MYDFKTLSPLDFEELVRDLLQAEFGLVMESFGPGRDQGIDLRFSLAGAKTIVQAKRFTGDRAADRLLRAVSAEAEKMKAVAPARYILATSVSLTPNLKAKIIAAMPGVPLAEEDIFGASELNNFLGRHEHIERQHFKLWLSSSAVLERILHSGVYNRTRAEIEIIGKLVPKFVQTAAVTKAEKILSKSGSLIISGEPGVGKTTLARILLWLHAEQDWKIYAVDDAKEAFEVAEGGEKRLILFDDFLGQIRLSTEAIRGIDQRLPPLLERVRNNKNLRFILTTRDYILHQAQEQSSRLSSHAVTTRELILNVGIYNRGMRARILFNHIFFSDLSEVERKALLDGDYFLKIIDHRNFNPRLVDLLTSPEYVSIAGKGIRETVQSVLDNPEELWDHPYRSHISSESRALLLAVYFNRVRPRYEAVENGFARMLDAMGHSVPRADVPQKYRAALKELEGSFIFIDVRDHSIGFANPGVRDFLQSAVLKDKLLPTAVRFATDYAEVNQTYKALVQARDAGVESGDASSWAEMASRFVKAGAGTPLVKLRLVVAIYDKFPSQEMIAAVEDALVLLEKGEIESYESDECKEVLEELIGSELPEDLLWRIRSVVTSAVGDMLATYGAALSLDDIQSVTTYLSDYGSDADVAQRAPKNAIRALIQELPQQLSELSSVDELDSFEDELKEMMKTYGVVDSEVTQKFDDRRDRLLEDGPPSSTSSYTQARSSTTAEQMTDQDIRSMFSGLRRGE